MLIKCDHESLMYFVWYFRVDVVCTNVILFTSSFILPYVLQRLCLSEMITRIAKGRFRKCLQDSELMYNTQTVYYTILHV